MENVSEVERSLRILCQHSSNPNKVKQCLEHGVVRRLETILANDQVVNEIICHLSVLIISNLCHNGELSDVMPYFQDSTIADSLVSALKFSVIDDIVLSVVNAIAFLSEDSTFAAQLVRAQCFSSLLEISQDYSINMDIFSSILLALYNLVLVDSGLRDLFTHDLAWFFSDLYRIGAYCTRALYLGMRLASLVYLFDEQTSVDQSYVLRLCRLGLKESVEHELDPDRLNIINLALSMLVSISNSSSAVAHEDIVELGVFYYVSKFLMSNLSPHITFLSVSLLANCSKSEKPREVIRHCGVLPVVAYYLQQDPREGDASEQSHSPRGNVTKATGKLMEEIAIFLAYASIDEWCRQMMVDNHMPEMMERVLATNPLPTLQLALNRCRTEVSQQVKDDMRNLYDQVHLGTVARLERNTFVTILPKRKKGISARPSSAIMAAERMKEIKEMKDGEQDRHRKLTYAMTEGPQLIQRKMIFQELLSTEKVYVSSLHLFFKIVVDSFGEYLLDSSENVNQLFLGMREIRDCHCKFLVALEDRNGVWLVDSPIVDLFLALTTEIQSNSCYNFFIQNYTQGLNAYCNGIKSHPDLMRIIQEKMDKSIDLQKLIGKQEASLLASHFFIRPVQRIPRYILMLEELCKCTPTHHVDQELIGDCLLQFKSIALKINETKKKVEVLERLTLLQEKIINLPMPLKRLVNSSRRIYKEGILLEQNNFLSNCYFYAFLFSDLFFITKQRRTCWEFKTFYPTRDILSAIENDKDDEKENEVFKFTVEILDRGRRLNLYYSCKTPGERKLWVQQLTSAAQDSKAKKCDVIESKDC